MELAGRSTVRFYRKHPTFDVALRLGMTPALARRCTTLSSASRRCGAGLRRAAAAWPLLARFAYQYHYLTGIKAALRDPPNSRTSPAER